MIEARDFVEPARALGFDWYAGVPCSFLTPFIDQVIAEPRLTYVSAANEGDALAAAAGAAIGGRRGVAMMQNSGLGNAVNPLSSLTWVFRIPVLLVVTLRGAPELGDEPQHELMGRVTAGLLETLEVPWEPFPAAPGEVQPALARAQAAMQRDGRPYALLMRKGSVAPGPAAAPGAGQAGPRPRAAVRRAAADSGGRPSRREALQRILDHTAEAGTVVIATTGYTGRELYALADRANHLYVVGSMGCASSLGLGLAMARPELRVVVVDGDGAALMRMGNFATLGAYGGANLLHLVLDNGRHESTGGQATVSGGVSFAEVAAACGYGAALEGESLALLDEALAPRRGEGALCAHLRIRPGTPSALPRPALTPVQVRERLMAHIGRSGA